MNCRKQCFVLSKGKRAEGSCFIALCVTVAVEKKRPTADYCENVLESRGIGVGSSPIRCEGFMKESKVQGSSLLLSNANNFVGYSYIYIYTSSTAQGGGGSLKTRKPIGEIGCCESGMAERIH